MYNKEWGLFPSELAEGIPELGITALVFCNLGENRSVQIAKDLRLIGTSATHLEGGLEGLAKLPPEELSIAKVHILKVRYRLGADLSDTEQSIHSNLLSDLNIHCVRSVVDAIMFMGLQTVWS